MRSWCSGWVCSLAILAGCLSDPGSGSSIDAGPDNRSDAAVVPGIDAAPIGPGTSFPPVGSTLAVEDIWSGDLNGDAIADLIVLSRSSVDQSFGAYVLYGQRGLGVPDFHAFLNTGTHEPKAVTAVQMTGDANLEILVYAVDFGTEAMNDNEGVVFGYEALSASEYAAQPISNLVSRVDKVYVQPIESTPQVGMAAGQFAPDAVAGIVVGMHTGMFQLQPESWESLGDAVPTLLRENQPMGGLLTIPSQTAGLDDVLGFEHAEPVRWFVNDGSGGLTGQIEVASLDPGIDHAAVLDSDGAGALDIIGVGDQALQLVLTGNPGSGHMWQGLTFIEDFLGNFSDLVVVEATGNDRPEVVMVGAQCTPGSRPCAALFPNVFVGGDTNLTSSQLVATFRFEPGFAPRKLASGDFDGDGADELIVVGQSGALVCLRIVATALETCD